MTSPASRLLQYLGSHLLAALKTDHRRAIDHYIDYFGDGAATGTKPLARRVTSVDSDHYVSNGASVVAHVEIAIRAVIASRRVSRG
jgi:hypothetical protein